ncbi:hypothetical protein [Hymenobacter lapidarius]|nr:hypothetical protein [Hymenobacter lapidarius]
MISSLRLCFVNAAGAVGFVPDQYVYLHCTGTSTSSAEPAGAGARVRAIY